jgi:tetratricopeptide (TPR) repeat protein
MPRLIFITAVALLIALFRINSAAAQVRELCITGVSTAPSVYIDSSSSEVVVLTTDGRQLSALTDLLLCPGDEVLTGATGRVAIRFNEKRTVIRLDGNSRTRILSGGTGNHDVSLLSGILHFVSSVRRQFWIDTPYIVAGIEGTEAVVAVKPRESLAIAAVRTGVVKAYDQSTGPAHSVTVQAGEAAFRSASINFQKAPISALPAQFRQLIVVSDSAVDWAIYYPPILLLPDVRSSAVRDAIELLSSGDYDRAAARLDAAGRKNIQESAALRTIIAVSRNRLAEAENWSQQALQSAPEFPPAHIAASYVQQASGDLHGALKAAETAERLGPDDPYVLARLAELQMTIGDRRRALKTAERALTIQRTPLALFVAGLAHLAAAHYTKAEALFREAIAIDAEAPLPRLGLGLFYIRRGETSQGAWEIERALAHDPRRASLRNWLGRAYFDERLPDKAREEFDFAKKEDPEDPNSYLFSAIERYAANRPVEALQNLQDAKERGRTRSVLRSERGLAEDAATVGAALGRIYDTLGFEQQAIVEGAEAVDTDPSNPGAHRFLAQAYSGRQGYEIVQTSELLRSQLLSPPSKTPVQPDLVETRLGLLDTPGPARVTFAEFAPLYDADGIRFDLSGAAGTQETLEENGAATLLDHNFSLSIGGYHYETDGFGQNNDVRHDVVDAVTTLSLTPSLDVFGELRRRETQSGDRRVLFDLDELSETVRIDFDRDLYRLGFHAMPGPDHDILGLVTYGELDTGTSEDAFPFTVVTETNEAIREAQLQYIGRYGPASLQVGGSLSDVTGDESIAILSPFGDFSETEEINTEQANAYGYLIVRAPQFLEWTLGLSVDRIDEEDEFSLTDLNPKLGFRANLTDEITLRGAYTNTTKRRLVADQTLEPTAVSGFSQFFDSFNGTHLERLGLGIDAQLTENLWVGAEATLDDMDAPGEGPSSIKDTRVRGYVNATVNSDIAISIAPAWERLTSDIIFVFEEVETTELPLTISYFGESGIFGSLRGTLVSQDVANAGSKFGDDFFVLDGTLGYRFPDQRGIVSFEVQNLLDSSFGYVERPLISEFSAEPQFARELSVLIRASLRF